MGRIILILFIDGSMPFNLKQHPAIEESPEEKVDEHHHISRKRTFATIPVYRYDLRGTRFERSIRPAGCLAPAPE
jgi:hypothetical protein